MLAVKGQGVHGFTLDSSVGEFILTKPYMRIPSVRACVLACVHVPSRVCCGAHVLFTPGSSLCTERDNAKFVRSWLIFLDHVINALFFFCSVAAVTPWMRAGEIPGRRRCKNTSTNCGAARGSPGRSSGTASSARPWRTCTVLW